MPNVAFLTPFFCGFKTSSTEKVLGTKSSPPKIVQVFVGFWENPTLNPQQHSPKKTPEHHLPSPLGTSKISKKYHLRAVDMATQGAKGRTQTKEATGHHLKLPRDQRWHAVDGNQESGQKTSYRLAVYSIFYMVF